MIEKIQKEKLTGFYKTLKTIYAAKYAIKSLAEAGFIRGLKGMYYGSEAISTGICAVLGEEDKLVNSCDGVGNLIAGGAGVINIFAEMLGRVDGCNKGVRGFLNISAPEVGIYSANSISDTQVAMGTGFALAAKIKGEKILVAAFYNGSTSNEGIIHESMNIASAFDLPVLFVCETGPGDTGSKSGGTGSKSGSTGSKSEDLIKNGWFCKRSVGYAIDGYSVDGMDVSAVYALAEKVVNDIRKTSRPAIIECFTENCYESFRLDKNSEDAKDSLDRKDAIISRILGSFKKELLENKIMTSDEAKYLKEDAFKLVTEAVEFAKNSAGIDNGTINNFMYADKFINMPKAGWSL
jgi:acetoin:2,6-dichlorophenolindophenol oxidoreductase subunit alpha